MAPQSPVQQGMAVQSKRKRCGVALLLTSASLFLSVAGTTFAGPLEDGLADYEKRDYVLVMRHLQPLAERGDAQAQYVIGKMHLKRTPADPVTSALWFRKASDLGHPGAQRALASALYQGHGVARDYAQAYFWALLAVTRHREYGSVLDILARRHLGAEQRSRIQSEVRAWTPTPPG